MCVRVYAMPRRIQVYEIPRGMTDGSGVVVRDSLLLHIHRSRLASSSFASFVVLARYGRFSFLAPAFFSDRTS